MRLIVAFKKSKSELIYTNNLKPKIYVKNRIERVPRIRYKS